MPAAPTLRVRLLGGLDLRLGEQQVAPLDSGRAETLLAYLLLHRDAAQPRQRLAFLLWPDSTESQARTNLRHVLHTLRRAVPDADRWIDVGPRTLQWRADAPLWLDVAVFEQALAEGRLEAAVEAYSGDLLEDSYDDWLLAERERLRDLHLEALERLARELAASGESAAAIRYAERLVRADPLREDGYQLLMRLHSASGDRARALRAYHVCVATLQRELGIEPSAATREAYEALLPVAPPRASTSPAGPALVGRAAEQARLSALWRASEGGHAQLALVTGEPGIGKSRLVEELRSWCAHGGAATAEARSYAVEGAVAYGPVVAWLRSEAIATRLRRLERPHLTELARLLPELLAEVPDLPAPEPLPESAQRQRLFEALARALLAPGVPLLLVADDLQWCDRETLQLLHYLLRAEPAARLLVAATTRREELDARHPVSDLITGLQALERLSEIHLERLSREETAVLAERIAAKPLEASEAARLYDDSEGNPLFVVEAARAPAGAGTGSRVQAVIAARLAQLSAPAGELVGVAATIGREFTAHVLADSSDLDDHAFVGGLDELWRRGVVRAQGPNAYDFSHGRIREAAYEALSPARRRHHHLRVAQVLERTHAPDLDAAGGLIAAHYEAAGRLDAAVSWHVRGAEAAQRLHAHVDAARSLERALELNRALRASGERDARELAILTALPAPLVGVDGYLSARVVEVHERALGLARGLGVEPEAPLVRSLALASLTRGDFDAARAFGEQLRARGERDGDDVLWVEGDYVLGVAAYWQGQLHAARTHFEAAVARYRPEHRTHHLVRYGQDPQTVCLMRLAHTLWLLGSDDEAARTRDATLALAAAGDPYSRAVASVWGAMLALDQRDEARLREHADALASAATGHGARQVRFPAEMLAGLVDVLDGRAAEGLARVQRLHDEAAGGVPAAPGEAGMIERVLIEACALGDDPRAGLAVADRALQLGMGALLWEAEFHRLRGEFLAALGAPAAEIETEYVRALEVAERQDARALALRARRSLDAFRA